MLTLRDVEVLMLRLAAWVFSPRLPVPEFRDTLRLELELAPADTLRPVFELFVLETLRVVFLFSVDTLRVVVLVLLGRSKLDDELDTPLRAALPWAPTLRFVTVRSASVLTLAEREDTELAAFTPLLTRRLSFEPSNEPRLFLALRLRSHPPELT